MSEALRPSRQFIIRGSIAIGIVAIILIVQTAWFRALWGKPPLQPVVTQTVGDVVTRDTNGNGVPDWEEKLWGLDPTVLYTDGVPNATIIQQKKQALGATDASGQPENETDALARELVTISLALGQSGNVSNDSLADIGAKLAESVEFKDVITHYSASSVPTVPTTTASLTAYRQNFIRTTAKYDANAPEIDLVIESLQSGDMSRLPELAGTKALYEKMAKELSGLPVPVGLEREHLEIVNGLYALAASLQYLSDISDNAINGMAGIALYKLSDQRISDAVDAVNEYLTRYGIIS